MLLSNECPAYNTTEEGHCSQSSQSYDKANIISKLSDSQASSTHVALENPVRETTTGPVNRFQARCAP